VADAPWAPDTRKGETVIAQTGLVARAQVTVFLILHVAMGCVAILAGAAALSARKDQPLHRKSGSAWVFWDT